MTQFYEFTILIMVEYLLTDRELVIGILVECNLELEETVLPAAYTSAKMERLHTLLTAP